MMPGSEQITFGALAIAANLLREICGPDFVLREVSFACHAPADSLGLRESFRRAGSLRCRPERRCVRRGSS